MDRDRYTTHIKWKGKEYETDIPNKAIFILLSPPILLILGLIELDDFWHFCFDKDKF